MQLLKLDIDYAFAFGKGIVIDFETLDNHTQIIGVNYEQDSEGNASNGSGKSSIPLALQECLYSKNAKGIKKDDIQNRNLKKGFYIATTFGKDENVYKVVSARSAGGKGSLALTCNGRDVSEHTIRGTLAKIEEVIGLDYQTFVQLTYQSSDKTFDILRANEAARAKLLVSLFGLEGYTEQASAAKEITKCANSDLRSRVLLQERLVNATEISIEPDSAFKTFSKDEEIGELKVELQETNYALRNIDEHNERVAKEQREVNAHNRKRTDALAEIKRLESKLVGKEIQPYSQDEIGRAHV